MIYRDLIMCVKFRIFLDSYLIAKQKERRAKVGIFCLGSVIAQQSKT